VIFDITYQEIQWQCQGRILTNGQLITITVPCKSTSGSCHGWGSSVQNMQRCGCVSDKLCLAVGMWKCLWREQCYVSVRGSFLLFYVCDIQRSTLKWCERQNTIVYAADLRSPSTYESHGWIYALMSLTDLEMVPFDGPKRNVHIKFRDKGRV
jgi:hypothetical protein